MSPEIQVRRVAAVAPVVIAIAVIAFLVLRGGDGEIVHAKFQNAGLLIPGNRVLVAGRQVGKIDDITVDDDGYANIAMKITDGDVLPLKKDARASIRALGQAGIANRYIDLSPGAESSPALRGDVLPVNQTRGIVDIDALLTSFTDDRRANLRELIENSDQVYAGSGSRFMNAALAKFSPAFKQLAALSDDLAADDVALVNLVRQAGIASTAVASRRQDLQGAIQNTATALGAVAQERDSVADIIERAPGFLRQARGTLGRAGDTLTEIRPALRAVPAAAQPLDGTLARINSGFRPLNTTLRDLRSQLPALDRSLAGSEPLAGPVVEALTSTGAALTSLGPTFETLRLYGSDLVIGALSGFGGVASGPYDNYGHYIKANFIQSPQSAVAGNIAGLLTSQPLVPGILDLRTGLTRRCPGGNAPPAPDQSNPWELGDAICSKEDNIPASVNQP